MSLFKFRREILNKKLVLKGLKESLEKELAGIKLASEAAQSLNQSNDLKSESKYDTRAIESGYLAGAQKARVEQLEGELEMLEEIDLELPTVSVATGHLVELEYSGRIQNYFLSPASGGTLLQVEGQAVLVISVFSLLGRELVESGQGDEVEIETPRGNRTYLVKSIR